MGKKVWNQKAFRLYHNAREKKKDLNCKNCDISNSHQKYFVSWDRYEKKGCHPNVIIKGKRCTNTFIYIYMYTYTCTNVARLKAVIISLIFSPTIFFICSEWLHTLCCFSYNADVCPLRDRPLHLEGSEHFAWLSFPQPQGNEKRKKREREEAAKHRRGNPKATAALIFHLGQKAVMKLFSATGGAASRHLTGVVAWKRLLCLGGEMWFGGKENRKGRTNVRRTKKRRRQLSSKKVKLRPGRGNFSQLPPKNLNSGAEGPNANVAVSCCKLPFIYSAASLDGSCGFFFFSCCSALFHTASCAVSRNWHRCHEHPIIIPSASVNTPIERYCRHHRCRKIVLFWWKTAASG